jgi:glycosyltransferase involved in cell wall biosynthesis
VRALVAIPVHNELKHVRRVLTEVRRYHRHILVIDDGSTDGTAPLLQRLEEAQTIQLIRHPVNRGYGQSIIDAFTHADARGYDWVITMDCDLQHEPRMIPQFLRRIRTDRFDIISGSRYLRPRCDDDLPPGDRRAVNATITPLINDLLGLRLTDSFCGYKAHRVCAMIPLGLDEPGYAFPMQLWPRAAQAGLRITEIPVRLIYNDPNRHFGGMLDDVSRRLLHYLEVLQRELRLGPLAPGLPGVPICCSLA